MYCYKFTHFWMFDFVKWQQQQLSIVRLCALALCKGGNNFSLIFLHFYLHSTYIILFFSFNPCLVNRLNNMHLGDSWILAHFVCFFFRYNISCCFFLSSSFPFLLPLPCIIMLIMTWTISMRNERVAARHPCAHFIVAYTITPVHVHMLSLLWLVVVIVVVVVGSKQHASTIIAQRALHFILLLLNRLLSDMKECIQLMLLLLLCFCSSFIFIVWIAGHSHSFSFTYRYYYLFSATVSYLLCTLTCWLAHLLPHIHIQCKRYTAWSVHIMHSFAKKKKTRIANDEEKREKSRALFTKYYASSIL